MTKMNTRLILSFIMQNSKNIQNLLQLLAAADAGVVLFLTFFDSLFQLQTSCQLPPSLLFNHKLFSLHLCLQMYPIHLPQACHRMEITVLFKSETNVLNRGPSIKNKSLAEKAERPNLHTHPGARFWFFLIYKCPSFWGSQVNVRFALPDTYFHHCDRTGITHRLGTFPSYCRYVLQPKQSCLSYMTARLQRLQR